jgi:hypothetical protein
MTRRRREGAEAIKRAFQKGWKPPLSAANSGKGARESPRSGEGIQGRAYAYTIEYCSRLTSFTRPHRRGPASSTAKRARGKGLPSGRAVIGCEEAGGVACPSDRATGISRGLSQQATGRQAASQPTPASPTRSLAAESRAVPHSPSCSSSSSVSYPGPGLNSRVPPGAGVRGLSFSFAPPASSSCYSVPRVLCLLYSTI